MDFQQIERDVYEWINKCRTNPTSAIAELTDMLKRFKGLHYRDPEHKVNIITNEGADAVHEAIAFLKVITPVPPLRLSKGLTQASRDHAYDVGPKGDVSHTGSDDSSMSQRMERYGEWNKAIAENISFSEKTGKDIVLQFIIDDGNGSRGQRKNIFNQDYTVVGIGVSYHKTYDVICVIDFAAEYIDHLEHHQKSKVFHKQSSLGNYDEYTQENEIMRTYSPKKMQPAPQQDYNTIYKESPPSKSMPQIHNNSVQFKQMYANVDSFQSKQPSRFMNGQVGTGYLSNNFQSKEKSPVNANFADFNFDDDFEWPEGAIKCKEKKHSKVVGNMKITKIVKLFLMKDGKTEIIENTLKELI